MITEWFIIHSKSHFPAACSKYFNTNVLFTLEILSDNSNGTQPGWHISLYWSRFDICVQTNPVYMLLFGSLQYFICFFYCTPDITIQYFLSWTNLIKFGNREICTSAFLVPSSGRFQISRPFLVRIKNEYGNWDK